MSMLAFRKALALLVLAQHLAAAEVDTGFFGDPEVTGSASVSLGRERVFAQRNKQGAIEYSFVARNKDGDETERRISKEAFRSIYLLASKAIREGKRSQSPEGAAALTIQNLQISGFAENVILFFEEGALPQNPSLSALLTRFRALGAEK